ncbi:MAG: CBS domain-containing protein [Jatrophihabitans sp.]
MSESRVEDVMRRDVVVVGEGTTYKQLVEILAGRQVRAVPVIGVDGRVLGMVSESDLLARTVEEERHHGLAAISERHRTHPDLPLTAAQLMTNPVITASATDSVHQAAVKVVHAGVRQLPVVDSDGQVIGIVSRGDLLRTFLRPDPEIRAAVENDVLKDEFSLEPATVEVTVRDGIVTLLGQLENPATRADLLSAVRAVTGVIAVEDRISSFQNPNEDRPKSTPHLYY